MKIEQAREVDEDVGADRPIGGSSDFVRMIAARGETLCLNNFKRLENG